MTQVKLGAPTKGAAAVARPQKDPDQTRYRGLLGAAVRARRETLRLTPEQLSEKLAEFGTSIPAKTIYAYEIGDRPIQIDDLPAFAKALKTTIKKLLPDA